MWEDSQGRTSGVSGWQVQEAKQSVGGLLGSYLATKAGARVKVRMGGLFTASLEMGVGYGQCSKCRKGDVNSGLESGWD